MAIKLNNLSKWQKLDEGSSILCLGGGGDGARKIVLNVNTEVRTVFYALQDGSEYLLAQVDGLEAIHFTAFGEVEVSAMTDTGDGEVWFWTDDGDTQHGEHDEDFKLFVVPMSRETRTPEMDALAARMQEKYERRFAMQEAHNERLFAQIAEEREALEASLAAAQKPLDPAPGTGEPDAVNPGDAGNPGPAGSVAGKA